MEVGDSIAKISSMIKMNTWAWIGVGGGIAGMLVGLYTAFSVGGSMGSTFSLIFLGVFGLVFFIIWRTFIGPMVNTSRLQKTGIPAVATILEVRDTGVTVNNNPQVKLVLEVRNNLGHKYTTSCRTMVSRINPFAFQPGMQVRVKIDPRNEQNVVIDYSGDTATKSTAAAAATATAGNYSQADVSKLQAELEKMQAENTAISATGRPARAIIKKYTWLGAYVNGQNPYAELEVEVLPEASAAFSATVRGVISEASVEKYQPGKEIYVKYDFYDNSKVTIDHS